MTSSMRTCLWEREFHRLSGEGVICLPVLYNNYSASLNKCTKSVFGWLVVFFINHHLFSLIASVYSLHQHEEKSWTHVYSQPSLSKSWKNRILLGTCTPTKWVGSQRSWRLQEETKSCSMGKFLLLGFFLSTTRQPSGRWSQATLKKMGMKKRLRWKNSCKFCHWSSMPGRNSSPFCYGTKCQFISPHPQMVVGEHKWHNERKSVEIEKWG